jgi:hypothetical protein
MHLYVDSIRSTWENFKLFFSVTKKNETVPITYQSEYDRYLIWLVVNQHIDHWNACDLLLTCPSYYHGCRAVFPDTKIVSLSCSEDLSRVVLSNDQRIGGRIGVLSPRLLRQLTDDYLAMTQLAQLCRDSVTTILDAHIVSDTTFRRAFHRVGFYEVARLSGDYASDSQYDYSSVDIPTGGDLDIRTSRPTTQMPSETATYLACRCVIEGADLPWHVIHGEIASTDDGYHSVTKRELALAIRRAKFSTTGYSYGLRVRGQFHWSDRDSWLPCHASLVVSYTGPSDGNMYAALIQPGQGPTASLCLWKSTPVWKQIACTQVKLQPRENGKAPHYTLPLWIEVTPLAVRCGTGEKILLSVDDTAVPRSMSYGFRLLGNSITANPPTAEPFGHSDE